MNTRRSAIAVGLLCLLGAGSSIRAEISAQLDGSGNYVRTVVFANASVHNLKIWTVTRTKIGFTPLNPQGDAAGDMWPFILETPTVQRWPWAVWSHFNGHDFDLVYSRWTGTGWQPTTSVETAPGAGDAITPRLAYDTTARPHLVWLQTTPDGNSTVMLSVFLATRWMVPFAVSSPDEAPTSPDLTVLPDGTIEITYDTALGKVTKEVRFLRPFTITDDITPFNAMWVSSMSAN